MHNIIDTIVTVRKISIPRSLQLFCKYAVLYSLPFVILASLMVVDVVELLQFDISSDNILSDDTGLIIKSIIKALVSLIIAKKVMLAKYRKSDFPEKLAIVIVLCMWAIYSTKDAILGYDLLVVLQHDLIDFSFTAANVQILAERFIYIVSVYLLTAICMWVCILSKVKVFISKAEVIDEEPTIAPYGLAELESDSKLLKLADNKDSLIPIGRVAKGFNGKGKDFYSRILAAKPGAIARYSPVHSFCIAPPGSGKGVGVVIPTLLDYDGPVVAIDPKKAENYHVTAAYRRSLGRNIYVLDPENLTKENSFCFNIFDFMPDDSSQVKVTIENFVASLIPSSRNEHLKFFTKNARNVLTCIFLHTYYQADRSNRNLYFAYKLLMQNTALFNQTVAEIAVNKYDVDAADLANEILSTDKEQFSGTLQTARQALSFMGVPNYRNLTMVTTVDLDLVFNNEADIYLCVPYENIHDDRHGAAFLKLFLALFIYKINKRSIPPRKKVLLLLDEMAALGRIECIGLILSLGRAYRILLFGITQTIGKLAKVYPEEIDDILTSSLFMMFGLRDLKDIEFVSKRIGETTVHIQSSGTNVSDSERNSSTSESENKSKGRVMALTNSQIMELSREHVFVFMEDTKPAVLKKVEYYRDKAYRGKFGINPFEQY